MTIDQDVQAEILLSSALRGNSYDILLPWFKSIGFRTQSLKYAHADCDTPSLALDYLVNSRCERGDVEAENSIEMYLTDTGQTTLSLMGEEDQKTGIELPTGPSLNLELGSLLVERRSVRMFTGDQIGLDYLASLLRAAAGVTAEIQVPLMSGGQVKMHYRTAPSAGGLYPIELYFAAVNIKGLEVGIYRYSSKQDRLFPVISGQESVDALLKTCAMPEEMISCSRSNVLFLLIAKPWKTMRKYGNRGLKFIFQEAGAISQNIHLATTALGLGSVDCASFYDNEVHQILGFDGLNLSLIHVIVLGVSG